jgi:hypothetical protein
LGKNQPQDDRASGRGLWWLKRKGMNNMPDYNPQDFSPSYGGKIDSSGNIKNIADAITGTGSNTKLKVDIGSTNVSLTASDIQIGAVEIKNGQAASLSEQYRMTVNSDGSLNMRIIGSIDGGVFGQ